MLSSPFEFFIVTEKPFFSAGPNYNLQAAEWLPKDKYIMLSSYLVSIFILDKNEITFNLLIITLTNYQFKNILKKFLLLILTVSQKVPKLSCRT